MFRATGPPPGPPPPTQSMAMSNAGPGFGSPPPPGGGGGYDEPPPGMMRSGGGGSFASMGAPPFDQQDMPGMLGRASMPLPPPGSAPPSSQSAPRNMPMMSMPLAPPSTAPPRAQSRAQSRAASRDPSRGQLQMGGGGGGDQYQVFGGESESEFGEFDYDPNFDPAWGTPQNPDLAGGGGGASEYSEYGASEYGASEYGASEYGAGEYGASEYGASEYGANEYGGGAASAAGGSGDPSYTKLDGKWVPVDGAGGKAASRKMGGGGGGGQMAVQNDWKKSMGGRWHVDSQKPDALKKFGKKPSNTAERKMDALAKNHWDGRAGGLPTKVAYAAAPAGGGMSRATVVNRRTKVMKQRRELPCGKYEVDTVAASFGDCYCGWKKLDHDKSKQHALRQQSRQTSRQTTRQKSRAVQLHSPSSRGVQGKHTPTGRFMPAPGARGGGGGGRQMPASVKRSMRRPVSAVPSSIRSMQQTGIRIITGTARRY